MSKYCFDNYSLRKFKSPNHTWAIMGVTGSGTWEEPEQYDPPPDGAGLLQERDRLFVPLAQLLVQLPQLPHPPQLPLTARPI